MNHEERYFPHHKLETEIGLAEYSSAATRLENEESAFNWATNTATLVASGVVYVALKLGNPDEGMTIDSETLIEIKSVFLILVLIISLATVVRFSNLMKKQVFAARKVIALRRMLGLSYGENTLVLPNWRVEGADHPFSIHMFSGFFSNGAFPVHLILLTASISIWLLWNSLALSLTTFNPIFGLIEDQQVAAIVLFYIIGCTLFRASLFDQHENFWLCLAKFFATVFRVHLVNNFELTMYEIKITVAEAYRIKTDFKSAKEFAVFIEDRQFFDHSGVNWKGLARAIWDYLSRCRKSGGSSITQQFARSNFMVRPRPTVRRKLVEMLLATWVNSVLTKNETLDSYLSTVRFDNKIYGVHLAYPHFYQDGPQNISSVEAFFLIERLANIGGYFLGNRIYDLLRQAKATKHLDARQINDVLFAYSSAMDHHFIQKAGEKTPSEISYELTGSAPTPPTN